MRVALLIFLLLWTCAAPAPQIDFLAEGGDKHIESLQRSGEAVLAGDRRAEVVHARDTRRSEAPCSGVPLHLVSSSTDIQFRPLPASARRLSKTADRARALFVRIGHSSPRAPPATRA